MEQSFTNRPSTEVSQLNQLCPSLTNQTIAFESLHQFPQDTNYLLLLKAIHSIISNYEEKDWSNHITTLNVFRTFNKYNKPLLYKSLSEQNAIQVLIKFLTSIRTALSKCTITFLKELFSIYEFEFQSTSTSLTPKRTELINLLYIFIPLIIQKANCDKSFLKDEAKLCGQNISRNMFYSQTILILLNECCNKNAKYSDIAFNCGVQLIENFERNYGEYYEGWSEIFALGKNIYLMKTDFYIKKPGKIISCFDTLLSQDKFSVIYKNYCNEADLNLIDQSIEYYKTKVADKEPKIVGSKTLQMFIKESKTKKLKHAALSKEKLI